MKITNIELAQRLGINRMTLHNWKSTRPLLYKIIMDYKKNLEEFEEIDINNIKYKIMPIEGKLLSYFQLLPYTDQLIFVNKVEAQYLSNKKNKEEE